MPQQLYPVPASAFISEYPTPDIRDYFVWERKDPSKPNYEVPDHGDLYPIEGKYPNHRFVRSIPEKDGGYVLHVYAAEREDQEDYNHVVSYPYGGNTAFPRYVRTYLTLREDYAAVALGTADVEFTDAVLVDQEMLRLEDSVLDSLFVLERRTYEIIPDLDAAGDLAEAIKFGYKVEYPYGVLDYPRVTWTIPCDSETAATPLTATCPIVGYRNTGGEIQSPPMYLIDQTYMREKQQIIGLTRVYERNPGPIIYESNYEESTGRLIQVSKQIIASTSVPSTAALLDAEVNGYSVVGGTVSGISAGTATTASAHGLVAGNEIYFSGLTATTDVTDGTANGTANYYVIATGLTTTQFQFATRSTGASLGTEAATGGGSSFVYKRTLARGTIIEYRPMDMDKLRSIQIVSKIPLDSVDWNNGAPDRVYQTTQRYTFPDRLNSVAIQWAYAASGTDFAMDLGPVIDITRGFSGDCWATITERITSNPSNSAFMAAFPAVHSFYPEPYTVPMGWYYAANGRAQAVIRTFTIPETIHAAVTVSLAGVQPPGSPTAIVDTVPATPSPNTYPLAGTRIFVDTQVDKWRFGMWVYRFVEIICPTPPA